MQPSVYCQATMNYAVSEIEIDARRVDVLNGREFDFAWQESGFELIHHHSQVSQWDDENLIAQDYYPEMEKIAKQMTGCEHALIGGHICRNPENAAKHDDYAPIQYVHSDFTHTYEELIRQRYISSEPWAQAALDRAGISLEGFLQASRIVILQFWRNVGKVNVDLPLAFCDARSVPAEDLQAFHVPEYGGEQVPFDTFGVTAPLQEGAHKWYTFPALQVDETVAFRTFDSEMANNGGRFWTPHSAFLDPTLDNPAARRSIETRATCLFYN